ncbi:MULTISPECIES: class I adenylate-forming enzyme family protein [unclassified Blastococcus]
MGTDEGIPYGRRLTELARARGDATALIAAAADGTEQRHGWADLERRANQVAHRLARAGVGEGDLVALGLPSTAEHVVATFAAWKLGAVVLPLRPELPGWERDRLLALAGPRLLIGDWPDAPAGTLTTADVRATAGEDDTPPPGDPVPPYARLIATSGSTGTPKVIVAPSPGRYVPAPTVIDAGQSVLAVCPLYHTNGFASCFPTLLGGDPVVLVERFDAARVVDLIERHRVSAAIMVPTMLQRIARLEGVRERDLSSLQRVVYGAAVLPEWVTRIWLELVPPERFMFTYGGSEALGIVACTGVEWLAHPGTTGRGTDCEVAILGAAGRRLPAGEVGEIWLRPLSGATEAPFRYVGAETPAPLEGGWRTFGDMGRLDDEGFLYIADRRQDMIVTGGVNVFPAEVEAALSEHPEVADVAVIGVPDPEWQRAVHAVVQPRVWPDPPAAEDLRAWCKERLSGPKVPKSFEFVEELPRTSAGKINRTRLAAERAPAGADTAG